MLWVGKDMLRRRVWTLLFLNLRLEHSLAIIGQEPLPAPVAVHTEPCELGLNTAPGFILTALKRSTNCTKEPRYSLRWIKLKKAMDP